MSRSGYTDEIEYTWDFIRWRGAVTSALRGKRGRRFLQDLIDALDALPQKRLIADELEHAGEFCALGALGHFQKINLSDLNSDDTSRLAEIFDIANALVRETVFINDEQYYQSPEKRWQSMRNWALQQLRKYDGQ